MSKININIDIELDSAASSLEEAETSIQEALDVLESLEE